MKLDERRTHAVERQRFEAWKNSPVRTGCTITNQAGVESYCDPGTEREWRAWLESSKQRCSATSGEFEWIDKTEVTE